MANRRLSATIFLSIPMIGIWWYLLTIPIPESYGLVFPLGFGFTAMLVGFYALLANTITKNPCKEGEILNVEEGVCIPRIQTAKQ